MIYLFYGEFGKGSTKAKKLLSSLRAKKEEASIITISGEEFDKSKWEEVLFSRGLFVEKVLIYGSRLFENDEHKAFIEEHIKEIKKSPNIFIFVEETLGKKELSLFTKHAEKVVEVSSREEKEEKKYSIFGFTDACGEKDKRRAFMELERALLNNTSPEEIHPLLFWQFKTILLVKTMEKKSEREAEKAGIKGFSYRKALSFSKNFSVEELKQKIQKLTDLFHTARFGGEDFELGLVQFVLKL